MENVGFQTKCQELNKMSGVEQNFKGPTKWRESDKMVRVKQNVGSSTKWPHAFQPAFTVVLNLTFPYTHGT